MFYTSKDFFFSYSDLIQKINETRVYFIKYHPSNYIDFITNVIVALIHNGDIDLIDYRNTKKSNQSTQTIQVHHQIDSVSVLIDKIKTSTSNIGIYSSGTEGPPKLIYQNVQRLLKSVQEDEKYDNSNWALTYNPVHSAGVQVFLQVLINKSCLCDLYKCTRSYILKEIEERNINFLSATPTFYRMLAPYDFRFDQVQSITLNGEKSTPTLIDEVRKCFPLARIRNIYGSTESGPLMSSDTSSFVLPQRLMEKVKIVDNELFIHSSILSPSVNNQEWYATGDMIEIINENPMTLNFISRKSRIINVGGQNVNPQEIEENLLLHEDITEAQVIPRTNKLIGNVITASIITTNPDLSEKVVIDFLKQKLASYKLPRIIQFVEEIKVGKTGKKLIKD